MKKQVDSSLKLLVKTSFIVFIGVFLSKVFTYLYRIAIARYFGPEVYGVFTLSITILSLGVFLFALGLGDGISRFIPIYRGKKELAKIQYVVRITKWISLISGILATLALFFLSGYIANTLFHNSELVIYLKIFSFLIPIMILGQFFLNIIRAYEYISWFSFIFNILQNLVKIFSIVLFIYLGLGQNSVIYSHFMGIASMLILGYLVCRYKIPQVFEKNYLSTKSKRTILASLFSYSLPFMPFTILSILLYWIDSFLIGYFNNATMVGIYNAAVPLAMLLSFVPELFTQLFFPLINKEYSKGNIKLIKEISQHVGKWIFILNLPIFILMIVFPGTLINILFGSDYLPALSSLRLLAIGAFISSLATISNNLVSMAGKSKIFFVNVVVASILNIALNFYLVPKYGIVGAAFATMISYIFLSLMFFIQAKYYTSIIPLKMTILKVLAVSLIPIVFVLLAREFIKINILNLALIGITFALLYGFSIILFRCLDEKDLMILSAIRKKVLAITTNKL